MSYTLTEKVKNTAILSRVIVLSLQLVSNLIIPDHDADAFVSPPDPEIELLPGDKIINFLFGGLMRWDAQYFMHIAQYGYTHENTLAFFPMFPLIVRFLASVMFFPLKFVCNFSSCLLLTAVILNFILFVKSALTLFKLSKEVLRNEAMAYRATLLFCINPASIFFTAPYSETVFCWLTFSALLINETRSTSLAAIPFGFASSTRSNGLVNIGFILYHKLQDCSNYFNKLRNATTESGKINILLVVVLTFNYTLIPLFVGCVLVFLPFTIFQIWCYMTYCGEEGTFPPPVPHLELYLRSNFLHSPDLGEAEWCYNFPPLAYVHVQDKFWQVGLLRYYEVRQVPNFLLALPVVMMIICHAALYMVDNPQVCWSLGIPHHTPQQNPSTVWRREGIYSWRVFVYTAHSLFLTIFCALCIHVQVTTRLLCSSSPIVYWFAAHLICDSSVSDGTNKKEADTTESRAEHPDNLKKRFKVAVLTQFPTNFWGQIVFSYFVLYYFLGIVLFSNFLPWT